MDERNRINKRYKNTKFRRFANITQMMIFSNNMEYDDNEIQPYQGAYYATSAYSDLHFNYFREEERFNLLEILKSDDEGLENGILKDNNLNAIKYSEEFKTNKNPDSPTSRILTSLLKKDRLAFILKYALAYVDESKGLEKHIMRYPQIFATKAIETKLNEGIKKGIIWHTQGSGKTALAFYNVKHLTDLYQQKGIIPKFYFIVDRLDLAIQASREFTSRDLSVKDVDSRQGFIKDIQTVGAIHNDSGKSEITVVNIQKFTEDTTVIAAPTYFPIAQIKDDHDNQFIDGGVWANNPSMVGFMEGIKYFVGKDKGYQQMEMLSISSLNTGAGEAPLQKRSKAFINWSDALFDVGMIGQSEFCDNFLQTMALKTDFPFDYFRIPSSIISANQVKFISLDNASSESIALMKQFADATYNRVRTNGVVKKIFSSQKSYHTQSAANAQ
ncbi:MAG: restriction endonuclease subunit [Mucilaginibacter sp.]|nr:restriction endonuclease subunit [Mucilaginibacter sp.]